MNAADIRQLIFADRSDAIDPYQMSDALSKVWKAFQVSNAETPCLRVSSMNLMVICSTPSEAEGLAEELGELWHKFPARIVVAVMDPEEKGDLSAWLAINCVPGRPSQLGCELVGLHCPGGGERLPSLLIPLLRDSLPGFLWWRGRPPFEASWFEHLVERSIRVILDSATIDQGHLQPIAALVWDKYHAEQGVSDLTWGRLKAWREMVAALFDRPANLARLGSLDRLEIGFWQTEAATEPPPMPLLLAGWLAARLHWKVTQALKADATGFSAVLVGPDGRDIEVRLTAHATTYADRAWRITAAKFSDSRDPSGSLSVERDPDDPERVAVSAAYNRAAFMHALHLRRLAILSLMAEQFETQSRDPVFESSLKAALELAGQPIPVRQLA